MDHNTNSKITKIFITGATGYIGGSVLTELLKTPDRYQITALIRSKGQAPKLESLGVTPIIGDLDSSEVISKASQEADLVINTANADHLESIKAIISGLSSKESRGILIHTSGTGVLADKSEGNIAGEDIFNDKDMPKIHSLSVTQPHKWVDAYIYENCQKIDAIIIAPPTIYGVGSGPFNRASQQIPSLIKQYIKFGSAATLGKGVNIWNHVHIADLAQLYSLILTKALEGKASTGVEGGWYFAESGEHNMRDVATKLGEILFAKNIIKDQKIVEFTNEEILQIFGEFAWVYSCNSRCISERSRELGWTPVHFDFFESFDKEVDEVLNQQNNNKF